MKPRSRTLKHSEVLRLLHYDPLTGIFTWRIRRGRIPAGRRAGYIAQWGYQHLRINDKSYIAHRIAWFYMTGGWPPSNLDHRNGIKGDNRWSNLRSGENGINSQNLKKAMKRNRSGFLGVHEHYGKWAAKIYANGHDHWLGVFSTAKAAYAAYVKAKRKLHPGCTI